MKKSMTNENKEKLIKLRGENKKESIELSNDKMYCMNCHDIFKVHKETYDERGCVDRYEVLHCCEDCGDCHEYECAWYCEHCKECHDGSEGNDLDLMYTQCPKCNVCFSFSLCNARKITCECGCVFDHYHRDCDSRN